MSAVKHQPATALPWHVSSDAKLQIIGIRGGRVGEGDTVGDACYIEHAANAYPKLVETLRAISQGAHYTEATTLLRDLGEEA